MCHKGTILVMQTATPSLDPSTRSPWAHSCRPTLTPHTGSWGDGLRSGGKGGRDWRRRRRRRRGGTRRAGGGGRAGRHRSQRGEVATGGVGCVWEILERVRCWGVPPAVSPIITASRIDPCGGPKGPPHGSLHGKKRVWICWSPCRRVGVGQSRFFGSGYARVRVWVCQRVWTHKSPSRGVHVVRSGRWKKDESIDSAA
jgi:hypothetical protein